MKKIFLPVLIILLSASTLLQAKEKEIRTSSDYEKEASDINEQIYKTKKEYEIKRSELYKEIVKIEGEKEKALKEYLKYELKQTRLDGDKEIEKLNKKLSLAGEAKDKFMRKTKFKMTPEEKEKLKKHDNKIQEIRNEIKKVESKYEKTTKELENKFKKEEAQKFNKEIEKLSKELEEMPRKLDKKIDQLRKDRTNIIRLKREALKREATKKIPEAGVLPKELKKAKKVK